MNKKRFWYTNNVVEMLLLEDDIPPKGFVRGRLKWTAERKNWWRQHNPRKGKPGNRKGIPHTQETKNKISNSLKNTIQKRGKWQVGNIPWNKGLTGCQVAWNKGISYFSTHTEEDVKNMVAKINATKKKNNSFTTSNKEEQFYTLLCMYFQEQEVVRQYFDKNRYPFKCDFYIKPLDLFIECNFHWTHGKHPFDKTNDDDIKTLKVATQKSKTSNFYKVFINV